LSCELVGFFVLAFVCLLWELFSAFLCCWQGHDVEECGSLCNKKP
jgi:hypothetical protein